MRELSRDEIKQIEVEVYNEGYRGYEFDEESTLRMLEAMDKPPLTAQESQGKYGIDEKSEELVNETYEASCGDLETEVSQVQQNIIQLLKCCGVSLGAAMAIMFMLETEKQQDAMLNWMIEQSEAPTEEQLLTKAIEITQ